MNLDKLEALALWLEDGAPHATLDMNEGVDTACGTVCCIAGAAQLMGMTDDGSFPPNDQLEWVVPSWPDTRLDALHYLGLPYGDLPDIFPEDMRQLDKWYGHPLFNPHRAPEDCTPAQAAIAVRRVMNGQEPWTNA